MMRLSCSCSKTKDKIPIKQEKCRRRAANEKKGNRNQKQGQRDINKEKLGGCRNNVEAGQLPFVI